MTAKSGKPKILVRVQAREGRVARTKPGGPLIPTAPGSVLARNTPYIQRLLNVHGDIVEVSELKSPEPLKPGQKPVLTTPDDERI